MSSAVGWDGCMQRTQDRVDRCKDSAAVAVGHDGVCEGGDDADGWLSPNLVQRLINGSQTQVVDDLGSLHGLPGGDVEASPVPSDIDIPDEGDQPRHGGAFVVQAR